MARPQGCLGDDERQRRTSAALADAGVTENDYRLIEEAQRPVGQVNARIPERGAPLERFVAVPGDQCVPVAAVIGAQLPIAEGPGTEVPHEYVHL